MKEASVEGDSLQWLKMLELRDKLKAYSTLDSPAISNMANVS